MRATNQQQRANNAIKSARQRSRDQALSHYPLPQSGVPINYHNMLAFFNEHARNIGGELLGTLIPLLQAAADSRVPLTRQQLESLRRSIMKLSVKFSETTLIQTYPDISNEERGRLDAIFIMLNSMKGVIDDILRPPPDFDTSPPRRDFGGTRHHTRRRARHTKNKTGRKRRTHRR
jgi:hypothetical protein